MPDTKRYHYKWRYADKDRPRGCCYDCRMKYSEFPDMTIPDELWEQINPTHHEGAGLLCPTCIANRLNYLGIWYNYQDEIIKLLAAAQKQKGVPSSGVM